MCAVVDSGAESGPSRGRFGGVPAPHRPEEPCPQPTKHRSTPSGLHSARRVARHGTSCDCRRSSPSWPSSSPSCPARVMPPCRRRKRRPLHGSPRRWDPTARCPFRPRRSAPPRRPCSSRSDWPRRARVHRRWTGPWAGSRRTSTTGWSTTAPGRRWLRWAPTSPVASDSCCCSSPRWAVIRVPSGRRPPIWWPGCSPCSESPNPVSMAGPIRTPP